MFNINFNPISTKEIQEARLKTCISCEKYSSIMGPAKCSACGCPIRAKIIVSWNSCPLNKWVK